MSNERDIDSEIREKIHQIHEDMKTREFRMDLHEKQISHVTKLVEDHIAAGARQEKELTQILEFVANINSSMVIANFIRRIILWSSSVILAIWSLWKMYKG